MNKVQHLGEDKILKRFKNMNFTPEEEQEVAEYFPQYILYRRNGKETDGYCTGCKQYLELEKYCRKPKHGDTWKCPKCGADITFYAGGKVPASRHKVRLNFVLFRAIDGELYMRALSVYQRFTKGEFDEWNGISDYDTGYTTYENCVYWCGEGATAEWKSSYWGGYLRLKECHEPHFRGVFNGDNNYIVIGLDRIEDTCLRYSGYEKFIEICDEMPYYNSPFVVFLCMSAKYPILEKLMKSGFEYIVRDKILHGGIRLNYRGDTPQKILRLNTAEVKALKGCNAAEYNDYLYFRKNIRVSGNFERRFAMFEKYAMIAPSIVEIAGRTGLSHEKVMNYIERQTKGKKQKNYQFVNDWRDYIKQCEDLQYDLTDESISKPADFQKMHERLSKLHKVRQDEIMRKQFQMTAEMRREFEYVGKKYIVIQPQSIDEIVAEGKALCHCVGGYADRHARGELSIMFLRMKSKPKKPYYTIEVSKDGKIVQCRGYRNNYNSAKPESIVTFEVEYQKHLDKVMAERKKRERRKKPIIKTKTADQFRIGA